MSNDLISREALKDHISELMLVYKGTELDNAILNAIDNAPTVEFRDVYNQGYFDGKRVMKDTLTKKERIFNPYDHRGITEI